MPTSRRGETWEPITVGAAAFAVQQSGDDNRRPEIDGSNSPSPSTPDSRSTAPRRSLHIVRCNPGRNFLEHQPILRHADVRHLRCNRIDYTDSGQRQRALLQNLRSPFARRMFHRHHHAPRARTRSIAPPIPFTIFPGIIQFAMLPDSSTSIAPSTLKSICPPRIIANESALEKYDVPGISLTVSFPALIRSGVFHPIDRIRPDPQHPVLRLQRHFHPRAHDSRSASASRCPGSHKTHRATRAQSASQSVRACRHLSACS